ncbi:unnamed protein product, partial [Chrysoparadoxa australica]
MDEAAEMDVSGLAVDVGASVVELCGNYESSCGYCKSRRRAKAAATGSHSDTSDKCPSGPSAKSKASSTSYGLVAKTLTCADYQGLIDRGWRRSGSFVYKPIMRQTCCPQYTMRLRVAGFRPSKRQRQLLNRTNRYLRGERAPQGDKYKAPKPPHRQQRNDEPADPCIKALTAALQKAINMALTHPDSAPELLQLGWRSFPVKVLKNKKRADNKRGPESAKYNTPVALQLVSAATATAAAAGTSQDPPLKLSAVTVAQGIASYLEAGPYQISCSVAGNGFINLWIFMPPQTESSDGCHNHVASKGNGYSGDSCEMEMQQQLECRGESQIEGMPDLAPMVLSTANIDQASCSAANRGGKRRKHEATEPAGTPTHPTRPTHAAPLPRSVSEPGIASSYGTPEISRCHSHSLCNGKNRDRSHRGRELPVSPIRRPGSMTTEDIQSISLDRASATAAAATRSSDIHKGEELSLKALAAKSLAADNDCLMTHRLEITTCKPQCTSEVLALYQKYQVHVHGDKASDCSQSQFVRFLVDSPLVPAKVEGGTYQQGYSMPCGSYHQHYRLDGRLIAVGVVDILPHCLSSVYCFYEPDMHWLSLGTLTALKEIEWVRQASKSRPGMDYYYIGYYIHDCPKMSYKGTFGPSELLCPERYAWVPMEKCRGLLDKKKYCRLSDALEEDVDMKHAASKDKDDEAAEDKGGGAGPVHKTKPDMI